MINETIAEAKALNKSAAIAQQNAINTAKGRPNYALQASEKPKVKTIANTPIWEYTPEFRCPVEFSEATLEAYAVWGDGGLNPKESFEVIMLDFQERHGYMECSSQLEAIILSAIEYGMSYQGGEF